jgi:signal transduction histidine kinase
MGAYRRARYYAHAGAILLGATLGGWVADPYTRWIIVGSGLAALAHAWLREEAEWAETAVVDISMIMVMTTATDIGEIIIIAVMAQVMVGWMFAPPRVALGLTVYGLALGAVGLAVVQMWERPVIPPDRRAIAIIAVLFLTAGITSWIMLASGLEVRRQRLENEELLRQKDQMLAEKNRLIATVSHELRTPLAGVVGFASMLADRSSGLSAEEREELARLIATSSTELSALVEDLLVAARLESGSLEVSSERVNLAELLGDLATDHSVDLPDNARGTSVQGDPLRIRQIVRNLLTNAERYGGVRVCLQIRSEPAGTRVIVRDDGDGVPEHLVDTIFRPFERAHTRPGRTDAAGLGLAISSQLAALMEGQLIYRRVEGWTSFELLLRTATPRNPRPIPVQARPSA